MKVKQICTIIFKNKKIKLTVRAEINSKKKASNINKQMIFNWLQAKRKLHKCRNIVIHQKKETQVNTSQKIPGKY